MKKIYLLIFSILTLNTFVDAQCVIDEVNTTIGITPNDLGTFCLDTKVNEDIQILVPNDTIINYSGLNFNVEFDSIKITAVNSTIPDGLSFECANDCWLYANETDGMARGCFQLTGTPTTESPGGSQAIEVTANLYATVLGSNYEYDYNLDFDISVLPADDETCIQALSDEEISSALSLYPNPSNGVSYINLDLPYATNVTIELFDVIGNKIGTVHDGNVGQGSNNISIEQASTLNSGMYLLKIEVGSNNDTNSYTERLIIE